MSNLLRMNDIIKKFGVSRTTLDKKIKEGSFPKGIKFSARITSWREEDIDAWMNKEAKKSNSSKDDLLSKYQTSTTE